MNRYSNIASSGKRSKLNCCITSSTSQFKHAQLSGWTLTRKRLNGTKQTRHATTDGIDPSQTLEGLIMGDRIQARLIHHLGLPITLHWSPAQKHRQTKLEKYPRQDASGSTCVQ
jgi:hypothetical protein